MFLVGIYLWEIHICAKLIIFVINILIIFPFRTKETYIELDNQISEYEDNIDFSNFSTDIKILALYLPTIYSLENNYKYPKKEFNQWLNIKNPNNKKNSIPRIQNLKKYQNFGYYNVEEMDYFQNQINLAKNHGIYGFAIYYIWHHGYKCLQKPLDLFLKHKEIQFKFLLILDNENWNFPKKVNEQNNISSVKDKEFIENLGIKFIKDIKKYMIDKRYIRINKRAILGINELKKIPFLENTILILRKKAQEFGIGELFIMKCFNDNTSINLTKLNLIDAAYDFPPKNYLNNQKLKMRNIYLYNEILYKYASYERLNSNFPIFIGNMLKFENSLENNESLIFKYYSPEQFYLFNKIVIKWTINNYESNERFIFVNSWNNWDKMTYLEPDEKYGYASLNSLSKALFNLSYVITYNLGKLNKTTKIAIHAHVYYENLIIDIIEKTNNIPVNFDLFISTDSLLKKEYINNYLMKSKAHKFEIQVFNNKGRDVLPLIFQMKKNIKKYKYFCHIHTKKSKHIDFGDEWRAYLFNNLLGNTNIISEILTEFENNSNLGFVFPEIYYKVLIRYGNDILGGNLQYMEQIIKKISNNLKISTKNLDYPMGNMFWARVGSVYQIFQININNEFPNEFKQIDGTLMHGIERIWIYIVKYNGFYYKKIFKHL